MLKEDGEVSPINVYQFATDLYGKDMGLFDDFVFLQIYSVSIVTCL